MLLCILSPLNHPFLHVSFIDVGQGDATLIRDSLYSTCILIDTGSSYQYYSLKKTLFNEGIYRIDDTPVHVAIREALANCLVNTDYFLPWNVVVEKYPDKIVLANPGTVRLGKKQMLRGGISQPRNRLLLNMFNFIGVGESASRRRPTTAL